jgi:hypothetical protein
MKQGKSQTSVEKGKAIDSVVHFEMPYDEQTSLPNGSTGWMIFMLVLVSWFE